MNNNVVTITGFLGGEPTFSHDMYGEGFYEGTLVVPRLSEQTDMIPITISERLLGDDRFSGSEPVTLIGQLRSYNKLTDGRSKLLLTVFVRDIVEPDDEHNPNSIDIVGYVCKPPIYRTTPFKREICDLLLAVNRAYNKSDYLPCIAWGRNARFARDLIVGSRVTVNGRVQSRIYQKVLSDGTVEDRMAYEVSVNRISLE